ncbi:malate synthase A [Microbacterium sp. MPKO10]|uniref:malate synthase A n=1 Tax=Microbacterium sp. MPKO10 TaxID=2989818 RepID=UPI002236A603|nr:malate synthase A [Microbacterium sp. MPKO10]MCW4458208.1 malate synthase A [Microbacterium sp. MPKO10]
MTIEYDNRITITGPMEAGFDEVLTPAALSFLTALHDRFAVGRHELLRANVERLACIDAGSMPDFLPETAGIRNDPTWRVAGAGPGLHDRRVEITGPTDRKMTVNALNSGAQVWLADHEDALSPTWSNIVGGQITLADAIRHRIDFTDERGKQYSIGEVTPTIVFRPRGWHLREKHLRYTTPTGAVSPVSASLVDVGLYLFHNAHELIARGRGPYFYLPKLESRHGARLWDEIFCFSEETLAIPHGTIRATVLIETITAAFEMEEILFELRDHCAGLNAGRWDYLFSIIKNFRNRGRCHLLPDRADVRMTAPFMRAYTDLLVATCHRRGAHAIGGMSAFIPNGRKPDVTATALDQTADDKRREAAAGFDGTWVAHPTLVEVARQEFDAVLNGRPHQLHRLRDDVRVSAEDLLTFDVPGGALTASGITQNVSAALRYIESWLSGVGAAAIDDMMEDAATAEISRSQLWHWIHQGALTDDGIPIVRERVEWCIDHVLATLPRRAGDHYTEAADLLRDLVLGEEFLPFFTVPAYARHLVQAAVPAAA